MHPGSFQGTRLDSLSDWTSPETEPDAGSKRIEVRKPIRLAGAGDEKARQLAADGLLSFLATTTARRWVKAEGMGGSSRSARPQRGQSGRWLRVRSGGR